MPRPSACHEIERYNGRLDALQAGILRIKLKHLPTWNEKRRKNAHYYSKLLQDCEEIVSPWEPKNVQPAYHLYVLRGKNRDGLLKHLFDKGIGTGLHYPIPLHLQKAYQELNPRNKKYPICEGVAEEIISLPMDPNLSMEHIEAVVRAIKEFYSK